MSMNPHARAAKAYLEELCSMLDRDRRMARTRRQWWSSPIVRPAAAVGLAAGLIGCGGSVETTNTPAGEICDDGKDNDGDGKVDCADPDCDCGTPVYAAPGPDAGDSAADTAPLKETDCMDGKDNDGDGKIDCGDSDCWNQPYCSADYAAPIEICNDGKDNDYDGMIDCKDPECSKDLNCMAAAYAAPSE